MPSKITDTCLPVISSFIWAFSNKFRRPDKLKACSSSVSRINLGQLWGMQTLLLHGKHERSAPLECDVLSYVFNASAIYRLTSFYFVLTRIHMKKDRLRVPDETVSGSLLNSFSLSCGEIEMGLLFSRQLWTGRVFQHIYRSNTARAARLNSTTLTRVT